MKADIKLYASSFSVVTLPVFSFLVKSSYTLMRTALDVWIPSRFASVKDMFAVR
jgi:hypothetical protein